MKDRMVRGALIALGAILLLSVPASTQERGRLSALASLQPGLWELRELGNPRAVPRSFCVGDPGVLMQTEHRGMACSRLVIEDGVENATIHYTCQQGGFGRTTIRVETPRLAVVDTQGIKDNMPFQYRYEARRKGSCPR